MVDFIDLTLKVPILVIKKHLPLVPPLGRMENMSMHSEWVLLKASVHSCNAVSWLLTNLFVWLLITEQLTCSFSVFFPAYSFYPGCGGNDPADSHFFMQHGQPNVTDGSSDGEIENEANWHDNLELNLEEPGPRTRSRFSHAVNIKVRSHFILLSSNLQVLCRGQYGRFLLCHPPVHIPPQTACVFLAWLSTMLPHHSRLVGLICTGPHPDRPVCMTCMVPHHSRLVRVVHIVPHHRLAGVAVVGMMPCHNSPVGMARRWDSTVGMTCHCNSPVGMACHYSWAVGLAHHCRVVVAMPHCSKVARASLSAHMCKFPLSGLLILTLSSNWGQTG